MSITTNLLRVKRTALSLLGGSALALGIGLFAFHPVKAALSSNAPLDTTSVAPLLALDQSMEALAARVTPAVVNISVTSQASSHAASMEQQQGEGDPGDSGNPMEQFRRFFDPGSGGPGSGGPGQGQQPRQIEHGIGSGILVSPDGYIVTNNHVVDGAMQIRVTLHDRRTLPAKLIGTDKLTDLAVIKVDATNLPSLSFGDSTKLQPGQTVLAFGSPFGYFQFSVTRGIVSALNRPNPYSDDAHKPGGYIQTDAAINPGNSGGPLVDARGEVIGINTFLISDSGSFAGAGFAIPSQIVRPVVASLIKYGKMNHGYLGIGINDVTPDNAKFFDVANGTGAVVTQVSPDSPAGQAGLRVGDVITALDGKKVNTASDLQMTVSDATPGSPISLEIVRDGNRQTVTATLGQLHAGRETASISEGEASQSGRLGVGITDLTPSVRQQLGLPAQLEGVAVAEVRPASPAENAGIGRGDVILQINRQPVQSSAQFRSDLEKVPANQDLLLLVWSNGGASYRVLHPSSSTESGM